MQLQEQLAKVEEEIAKEREYYNRAVLNYNNDYLLLPTKFFATIIGFRKHEYFKISDEEKDMPEIKF